MVCQNCFTHIADGLDKCPVCDNDPTKKEGGADMKVSRERDGRLGATCHALPPLDNKGVFVLAVQTVALIREMRGLGNRRDYPFAPDAIITAGGIKGKCFQSVNTGDLIELCKEFCNWFWATPSANAELPEWIEFETGGEE